MTHFKMYSYIISEKYLHKFSCSMYVFLQRIYDNLCKIHDKIVGKQQNTKFLFLEYFPYQSATFSNRTGSKTSPTWKAQLSKLFNMSVKILKENREQINSNHSSEFCSQLQHISSQVAQVGEGGGQDCFPNPQPVCNSLQTLQIHL